MAHLTRLGARAVTTDLDRLANLVQHKCASLGIPDRVAMDFARKCDLLSDHIEKYAIHLAKEAGEDGEVGEEVEVDAKASKKAADETGLSVEPAPGNQGFDANDIGDKVPGPLEILPPAEGFMSGHFTQDRFQQLRTKQESGQIGFKVSAALASVEGILAELRGIVAAAEEPEEAKEEEEEEAPAKTEKAASSDTYGYPLFS